jgi:DNA repair exonuclease SbcCD ATPase subunit
MEILYIGSERSDAQVVASVLRSIDDTVTVLWASHLDHAVKGLDENRDLAALIVDIQVSDGTWPAVVSHARSLASRPAIVAILPEGSDASLPGVDGFVRRSHTLPRDLPIVVIRAIELAARVDLEQKLTYATSALDQAEQRRRTAADRLAALEAQYEVGAARAAATWEMVDEQLRTAALEVERARQGQAAAAGDVERLSHRDAELSAQLADTVQAHDTLAHQLTERQQEFESRLGEEVDRRQRVEVLLARAVTVRDEAQKRHALAMTEAAVQSRELQEALRVAGQDLTSQAAELARLTTREKELSSTLSEVTSSRQDFERRLSATQAAFDDATMRATRERLTVSKKAADREAELDGLLQEERTRRADLEAAIAKADGSLRDAQQRHDAALAAAADALAERQARFDRALSETTNERDRLARQLDDTDLALDRARQDYQSAAADVERLTRREADLTSQLAAVQSSRDALERQVVETTHAIDEATARETSLVWQLEQARVRQDALEQAIADATSALRDAEQRHEEALATAAAELAARDEHFGRQLSQTQADRDRLSRQFDETDAALNHTRKDYQSAIADVERLTRREADLTSQLADIQGSRDTLERHVDDANRAIAEAEGSLRDAEQRHDAALAAAAKDLADRVAHFDRALSEIGDERDRVIRHVTDRDAALGQVQQQYESAAADLERLTDRATDLVTQLADVQAAHDTLERQLADATTAMRDAAVRQAALDVDIERERTSRSDLEQVLGDTRSAAFERESQLAIQLAQAQLEQETRLTEAEARHRALALERDTLQTQLTTLSEQVQQLGLAVSSGAEQLATSRLESDRLFDQAGVAMFRCTRDGAFTEVNRACATLIGRRMLDDGIDIAAAVFEDPNVLTWLIERCLTTRTRESVETTWQRPDGSRLFMRLSARSCNGIVEVVAEDLTRLRVLEERLSRAQRMEAVGRFAQEVAVTCGGLLDSLHQKGREWLTTAGRTDARVDGERLFDDIGHAAALLRELAACGDEQTRSPMQVDLNTLIRDLEPVLKRVAGGDVEVQLRDTSSPLTVDVGIERVERLLVNLASYGRGRMPSGGRLTIELGTSVVDRRFAAKHPNVRLGLHALITVTETGHRSGVDQGREKSASRSGVDFGTLQGLVSECGGHLWMKVQPPGDMVAKIRLPLLSARDQALPRTASRMARGRLNPRWLQSGNSGSA